MSSQNNQGKTQRARMYWRCRRGLRELDLVLMSFFERHYDSLSSSEKDLFAELLSLPDPLLESWLLSAKHTNVQKKNTRTQSTAQSSVQSSAERTQIKPQPKSQPLAETDVGKFASLVGKLTATVQHHP